MKISKSEFWYLILSLIFLIASAGIYMTYADKHKIDSQQTSSWKEEAAADFVAEAEELLKQLEANPNDDLLADTRLAVKRVTDTKIRQAFNDRVAAIETLQLQIKTAEEAVAKLESEQTSANLDAAQVAVNAVSLAPKKTELQNRIEAIRANLLAQQTVSATPQPIQPAEPAVAATPIIVPEPAVSEVPQAE